MRKKYIKDDKGIVLISGLLFCTIIIAGALSIVTLSQSQMTLATSTSNSNKAFFLAESGIDVGIYSLSQNAGWSGATAQALGEGEFTVANPVSLGLNIYQITSTGFIPSAANPEISRTVIATAQIISTPANFFDGAIFTSGEIEISGNAHIVNGNVIAGDEVDAGINIINGTVTENSTDAQNLPLVDFSALKTTSLAQIKEDGSDNVYTAAEITAGTPALPTSFYFDDSDPDPANWIPNIVYIESDLTLAGQGNSSANAGGILLVVGDILVNPGVVADTDISGNANVDGVIYTTGSFTVNGGGNTLNVTGGVWAGDAGVELKGNVDVIYNSEYMSSAAGYMTNNVLQVTSWSEAN